MPRRSASNVFGQDPGTTQRRFLCPVKSCQRAFISKTGWTKHLRLIHPNLHVSRFQSESPIVNLPFPHTIPTLNDCRDLATSPPSSPVDFNHPAENDFEMVDLDVPEPEPEMPSSPSESFDPDADNEYEYHPIINGKSLLTELRPVSPNKFSAGIPCDKYGNTVNNSDAPPLASNPRDLDDWTPFENYPAFELAEFFYKDDEMAAGKIDKILGIISRLLAVHGDQPPFIDHKDVYRTIDLIPHGVPWQCVTFSYEGPRPATDIPRWMNSEYEVWFRDSHLLLLDMVKNPDFVDYFDYAPSRRYDENGDRQYENFMSGDWAWKQAVRTCWLLGVRQSILTSLV